MVNRKNAIKILFIGKADDHYSQTAADFIQLHFAEPLIVFSKRTEPFPGYLNDWEGDLIISYLAQWIIPGTLLEKAKIAAINLHPGPPEYPGIGCTNFAVYNGEKEFGVTCHHMLAKVDSGMLIAVRRFPVFLEDTVYSITQRCYNEILHLFYELISRILRGEQLPVIGENWKRKPYTRKQLNQLCELTRDMDKAEIERRMRATTYGDKVWAYMKEEKDMSYSSHKK
jgi:methionyl-tRNA formyltransferase